MRLEIGYGLSDLRFLFAGLRNHYTVLQSLSALTLRYLRSLAEIALLNACCPYLEI